MPDPVISLPPGGPMPANPLVAAADPAPVTPDPNVTGCGRDADDFDTRRRRRHHHDTARVVILVGSDHASRQRQTEEKAEAQSCVYPVAPIHACYRFA